MRTILQLLALISGLNLVSTVNAATNTGLHYFEGELLVEKSSDREGCQRIIGNTKNVQISWQETKKGRASRVTGWIVYAGGAPGKLDGPNHQQMSVTTNYYDAHLNTPATLTLNITDDKVTGTLQETQANLGLGEAMCYWQQAKLTLTEKTRDTDVSKKMREHAAWYRAYRYESRGEYLARTNLYAQAAVSHDQAIAEVDGVLPETYAYFTGLLNYTATLYFKANDFEQAAQRYQRFMDISVRKSEIGAEDPVFYRGWVRLATNLLLAKRIDEAIVAIERAARQEDKAEDVELTEQLLRLRLQGNIYRAAQMFDKAQTIFRAEIDLATIQISPHDQRTFEAQVQLATVLLAMKDNARFEAVFEPLAKEITTRFGESNALARNSNQVLGMYYYRNENLPKARRWLESAFRGHRTLVDSAAQAVREDEEAKSILASLLDIYIKQNIVQNDFLDGVKAGETSLDDLPFRDTLIGDLSMPPSKTNPRQEEMLLKR